MTGAKTPVSSLRAALVALAERGDAPIVIDEELDPCCEIARHYLSNFATSPAHPRSGTEPVVMYTRPKGFAMPVLLGLFGARSRCEFLLGCEGGAAARKIGAHLDERIKVQVVRSGTAPSQAQLLDAKLAGIPILSVTRHDAGPYLTSGLVVARDLETGVANISIHRMRMIGPDRLTIWMLPGRDLDRLHRRALELGRSLPVSINIGVDPVVYLTSSISSPFLRSGESELELAGAIGGHPVVVSTCGTQNTWCLAESEIVIEGEITGDLQDEYDDPAAPYGMPEFLGYMGMGKAALPVIKVTRVTTRSAPIYQTFLGPGKEQSELLAIPTEAGMLSMLSEALAGQAVVHGVHYLPSAGGQLFLAVQIEQRIENENMPGEILQLAVQFHSLLKAVFLVDRDVDIHSESDLIWALATRFQPSVDLVYLSGQKGFPLDPSQAAGYFSGTTTPTTDKYIMDLTVKSQNRDAFRRLTSLLN